jgi:hypothetical protein
VLQTTAATETTSRPKAEPRVREVVPLTEPPPARETGAQRGVPPRRAEVPIDPRVAKHGGTRAHPKASYEFPGMMDAANWRRTEVHGHTAWYGCTRCGARFAMPHAVYTHLAKVHDR